MTDEKRIKLFSTHPHPCSYFDDREAKTLFVDPDIAVSSSLYSLLSQRGFRRSGNHYYRPNCEGCQQCIPCRVPVAEFTFSRNQRKLLNRNADLTVVATRELSTQAYGLYERYINARHTDGDMYPADPEQFASFITEGRSDTRYIHFYDNERLISVAVSDPVEDGVSAIYTFYDPDDRRRSLGKYAVLWQIMQCQQRNLPYVYLGYWIRDCNKMRYKTNYRPIELLMSQRWIRLN